MRADVKVRPASCIGRWRRGVRLRRRARFELPHRSSNRLQQPWSKLGNILTWDTFIGCTIIVVARVADVSLGTMRTVAVLSGHRGLAWLSWLLEVGIWVFVVAAVIAQIQKEPAYGVAFAFGAATGNYVGVVLQRWLPFGDQVVRVFTRRGGALFDDLQHHDFRATKFLVVGRLIPAQRAVRRGADP